MSVLMIDGGTRVDVIRYTVSCLVSKNMSNLWEWNVITDTNIGNYHFPILCSINSEMHIQEGYTTERWSLEGFLGMSDKMRECYKAVFF